MPVVYLESNVNVLENAWKIAVKRGPVVYCAEQVDNGSRLDDLSIDVTGEAKIENDALLLKGKRRLPFDALYRKYRCGDTEDTEIKLVPYHTFANRGISEMRVWFTPVKGDRL